MKTIIFACVHNAGRPQMAAAFLNKYANPNKASAISAGAEPADKVHPEVLRAMSEFGIDLSSAKPSLTSVAMRQLLHYFKITQLKLETAVQYC